jgi:hypothetical protein
LLLARFGYRDRRWNVPPAPFSAMSVCITTRRRGAREAAARAAERAKRTLSSALDLCLLPALVDDLEVVVEDRRDDGNHVSLDDASPDGFRTPDADVDDALESQVPLPHLHHVLAPALLENAYEALDAAIDSEDVANAAGGGCEVCEVVQRVDEGEGRGAVKRSTVIEGGGDADGRLVCVRDAEVDLAHVCAVLGSAWRSNGELFDDRTGKPDGAGVRVKSQVRVKSKHRATLSLSLVCRDGGNEV